MIPSIYVIQKSTGDLYCVTQKHYEEYKNWYDLPDQPKDIEVVEKLEEVKAEAQKDPLDNFDVSATLTPPKRGGRPRKEK